jgi:hypothetical protein
MTFTILFSDLLLLLAGVCTTALSGYLSARSGLGSMRSA